MNVRLSNLHELRGAERKKPWEIKRDNKRINELGANNQNLAELARIDALTGLANRRMYDESLLQNWARFLRDGKPFGYLLLDLNNFKLVNDSHGHELGDKVLKMFANVLKKTVRTDELIFRYGGDEVVILTGDGESRDLIAQEDGKWVKGDGPLLYRINYLVNQMIIESKDKDLTADTWKVERMIGDVPFRVAGGIAFSDEEKIKSVIDLRNLADERMYIHKRTFGLK